MIEKSNRPFFSFIIPVYNVEEYIGRCIDSIASQSMRDIEIILVNDSSTDRSLDIIESYARDDSRIHIISYTENRSAHCARMDGVRASKGHYIWFVDGDDEITEDACRDLHALLSRKPVDILHFGTKVVNDGGLPEARVQSMQRFVRPFSGNISGKDVFEYCFVENKYKFNIWNKVFHSGLCKKAFSMMEYEVLPKAQDKYEYYALSYYARSYHGMPDREYYVYHFGTGITGHNLLTPKTFQRYCTMADSYEAIERFSIVAGAADRYRKTLDGIKQQLFDDCFANWNNNLSPDDKGICFDMMVRSWGGTYVVSKMANKNWYNQGQIASYILKSELMVLPGREVKTIATFYHTYTNGGVQRVLTGLMKFWLSMGYRVILITDENPTDNDYYFPPEVKRVVIPSTFDITRDTYGQRAEALTSVLKENNVDVLVYHAWVSNILLWDIITCKLAGVAFISHCHNIFSMLARSSRAYFASLPNIYRLCDAVVTLSDVDRQYWSNFNRNVFEVFNPFSFDLDSVPQSSLNSKTVLWIGRMSDEKRPKDALKIMKEVLASVPDAKLMMVGGGNPTLMNNLYQLIDEYGIRDSVVMHGFLLDVLPIYQFSSVLLCTSEYEGFLLTLAEAQSAGVPCVMYELPYLTLTRRNLGIVQVPQMNTSLAAKEVVRMLNDEDYRKKMGAEARECITSYRDYDFVGVWRSIFDSLRESNEPMHPGDATQIMWDTLMTHYRTGVIRSNTKIDELSKQIAPDRMGVDEEIIKHYETEISNIKNSMTYRIGELITYLPKYIRGDFKK